MPKRNKPKQSCLQNKRVANMLPILLMMVAVLLLKAWCFVIRNFSY